MDVRRRPIPPSGDRRQTQKLKNTATTDSQTLLPLYLTNALFFAVFFSVAYFLLHRWREKIRTATPLHAVTPAETAAIVSLVASAVYLLGFFGVASRASLDELSDDEIILKEDSRAPGPCAAALSDSCSLPNNKIQDQFPLPPRAVHSLAKEKQHIPSPPQVDSPVSVSVSVSSSSDDEDEEIVQAVVSGSIPSYSLESRLGDTRRAATIRHEVVQRLTSRSLSGLPLEGFNYDSILGQCCEMPIGFVQIPVGVAGPLLLDGKEFTVPMATTEGCLVASTNRGCKAIYVSGGASSVLLRDGMTRAPVVRFPSAQRAAQLKFFLEDPLNFDSLAVVFNKSSRFARLQNIQCAIAGKNLYMRFRCSTGDAMGMNMVSKGVQNVLDFLQSDFPDMDVIGISGNFCSDKKAAAVNWIEGRGKSVVCEAIIKDASADGVLRMLEGTTAGQQHVFNIQQQDLLGLYQSGDNDLTNTSMLSLSNILNHPGKRKSEGDHQPKTPPMRPRKVTVTTPEKPTLYKHTMQHLAKHFSVYVNNQCVIMKVDHVDLIPKEIRIWIVNVLSSEKDVFESNIMAPLNSTQAHPFQQICKTILYDFFSMTDKGPLNRFIGERKYTVDRIVPLFKAIQSVYREYSFDWIEVQASCIKDIKELFPEFDFTLNKVDGIGSKVSSNKEMKFLEDRRMLL